MSTCQYMLTYIECEHLTQNVPCLLAHNRRLNIFLLAARLICCGCAIISDPETFGREHHRPLQLLVQSYINYNFLKKKIVQINQDQYQLYRFFHQKTNHILVTEKKTKTAILVTKTAIFL